MNRIVPAIVLLLALPLVAAPQSADLAEQRLASAADRYDAASWPTGSVRSGLPPSTVSFDGYQGGPIDLSPGAPVKIRFADQEGVDRFLVEIACRETAAEARTVLLEQLASVNSPRKVPTAASLDIAVGDVGFVGRAPEKRIAWIAFLRGNITIRLTCLDPRSDPHPEMDRMAIALDRQILDQPTLTGGEKAGGITVTSLTAVRQVCRAGDAVALNLQASDSPAAIRWVVGGPGQGYVERDRSGGWILHTTKEGAIDLACHVLGPNGFTASKTAAIEVKAE